MQTNSLVQHRQLRRVLALLAVLLAVAAAALLFAMGDAGRATAGEPLPTPTPTPTPLPPASPQLFSVQAKQLSGPADRMDISFGKPDQALKVTDVFAFAPVAKEEICFGNGFLTDHIKDVNPDPALPDHEVWTLLFIDFPAGTSKCVGSSDELLVFASPLDNDNHLVIKDVTFYNTSGTPEFADDVVVGVGNAKKLDWGKIPRLSNLWLCTQPAAVPQCNAAVLFQVLGQPITSPDPKCPTLATDPAACPRQELGSFEYEMRFDSKFLDVELITLPIDDGVPPTCLTNHREGIVNLACVTKGKDHPLFAPNILSVAVIRPKPDLFSLLIANQQNGVATQLINQGCQLADLQGHPIPLDGLDVCQDGAVTIRYLEGDVHADCVVDVLDQQQIAFRWGSRLGNLLYNSRFDLEPSAPKKGDGDIDAKDLQMVYGRHGSTCHDPHPKQVPVDPKAKPPTPTPTPTPPRNVDEIVDLDGIATNGAGGPADQQVAKGDHLVAWVPGLLGGTEGIDVFDNDSDGAWTQGVDDIHLEDSFGSCSTGIRDTVHNLGLDCVVLDLDKSLFDGQPVTCDLEGNIAFITPCPALLKFHDANGNGVYDNGEDIVLDVNNNNVFD